jgi:hypothetical protein
MLCVKAVSVCWSVLDDNLCDCAVSPVVGLLAVVGTGVVLWIWTRSRKASPNLKLSKTAGADASADPALVRGIARGVAHRR